MRSTLDWESGGVETCCKAEPEEAAYEHADSKIECDRYPSFFRLRIPRRAHRPTASMAGALEWRVPAEFQSKKRSRAFAVCHSALLFQAGAHPSLSATDA